MCGFTVIFRCQKLFEFNFVILLNTFFLFLSLTLENHLMRLLFIQISLNIFIYRIFREIEKKPHVLDLVLELFMHTEMKLTMDQKF